MSLKSDTDLWVTAAQFDSLRDENWDERVALLRLAQDLDEITSLAQWHDEVAKSYPSITTEMTEQKGNKARQRKDNKARAFYLKAALQRLLELVNAPDAIIRDAAEVFDFNQPRQSEKRGVIQRILIDNPELIRDPVALAKKANCSRRLAERYMKEVQLLI